MLFLKKLSTSLLLLLLAALDFPACAQQPIGLFTGSQDIGPGVKPGAAAYRPATRQYVISGAGRNIWDDHDEFRYTYRKITGDFLLYARAGFEGGAAGAAPHRKLGWMVRQSLAANSPQVSAAAHGDGLAALQFRKAAGGPTEEVRAPTTHADVIQLERKGTTYTLRMARFGQPFVTAQVAAIDLGDAVYVGLFVGSHNAAVAETGMFRDVRIVVPAPATAPAQGYLGSSIEVLDVATGSREVVYTSAKSLQAPNWQRDGKSLLYNSDGLMYTLDLATRRAAVLPTGDVRNNNNDHVLSFDGKMLGLSSGVDRLGGSIVYTVPAGGGTPRQITATGPSYLHGWSPDGKSLLFIGQRQQEFDVYRIPAAGGPEVRLTTAPGLDDGAEYTPDGQYIYFNSDRTGAMRLWRMKPDGSQQEAVTTGDYYDWFPHVSPNGKWIAFISFLKDEVAPGDHPFYKHVYLRLLPVGGGEPRVIAYVYGGQGSMNTPSWSPDSKKIAFVSNSADTK